MRACYDCVESSLPIWQNLQLQRRIVGAEEPAPKMKGAKESLSPCRSSLSCLSARVAAAQGVGRTGCGRTGCRCRPAH